MQWAETAEDACLEIAKIVNQTGGNFQYDDKSRIFGEIGLDPFLHKSGLNRLVVPFSHENHASTLIVNGAFMVSESGFVLANIANAHIGNRWLVVVVGIEQIVASLVELAHILELLDNSLPSSALLTGKEIENCNLIVVDNGRSDVLNLATQSELLAGVNHFLDRDGQMGSTDVYPGVSGKILGKYLKANKQHFEPEKVLINGYYNNDVSAMPITDILLAELNAWAQKNGAETD
ncbi:MAG: hypothetical protein KDC92_13240, partial [Bacteroidetes bacterium]|nr:hypothetical protein [Bacteroidota bacterium]